MNADSLDHLSSPNDGGIMDATPLKFGKFKGKTPEQVAEIKPDYLVWAYENVAQFAVCSDALYRECGGKGSRAKGKDANDEYERAQRKNEEWQRRPAQTQARAHQQYADDDDLPF